MVSKIGREQLGGEGASEVSGSAGDQVMMMTEDGEVQLGGEKDSEVSTGDQTRPDQMAHIKKNWKDILSCDD